MKPAAFEYIRVETLDEALSVLAERELEAKILAGGQSLLPLLNMRLARPGALIDVNRVAALQMLEQVSVKEVSKEAGDEHATARFLQIGALVRQRQLERYAVEEPRARLLHAAIRYIGHPQTRNQGTIGGSLAHADPSAELPLLFLTLGGTAFLQSMRGERQVAAEQFFQSYYTTVLESDELLTKTLWRLPAPHEGVAFREQRRRHGDFALVAAACTMTLGSDRSVLSVRLGMAGVADTPLLVNDVQQLVGERLTWQHTRAIAEATAGQLNLPDDYQASSSYRRQLATVVMSHTLMDAYEDALTKNIA